MEVGKLILNVVHSKAHITVSVKPFGCMPSSGVSDGVQSLITARYPGTIFCAVETSGDGATNFYSRVQMYMFKARQVAENELDRVLGETGLTRDEVRGFLAKNPKYASALHKAPHRVAGSAADLVLEVAPLIKKSPGERMVARVRAGVAAARSVAQAAPGYVQKAVTTARDPEFQEQVREDAKLVRDVLKGKAEERFGPLVKRLTHRAFFEKDPGVAEHVAVASA